MQNNETIRPFLRGALSVSVAALFAKVLSAAYRVPYQNMAGDLGFYAYQQIYPFHGIAMILAMYGFPVYLSKVVTGYLERGEVEQAKAWVSFFFYRLILLSVVMFSTLYVFAERIALVMGDINLTAPLQTVAFSILLIPLLSVVRGVYQAHHQLEPTALSHVTEQIIRVIGILCLVGLFMSQGGDGYDAAVGAALGSIAGSVGAIIVLLIGYRSIAWREWLSRKNLRMLKGNRNTPWFRQSVYICLSSLVFVLVPLVDAFTMIRLLGVAGIEGTWAFIEKGIYDRGQPLVQVGIVVATSFSLAIVPFMTKAVQGRRLREARTFTELACRFTILISGAAALGLFIVMEPTNILLFGNSEGTHVLQVYGFSIFFASLFVVTAALLQGSGYVHIPMIALAVSLLVKMVANVVLIPAFTTVGAAIGTIAAYATMATINVVALSKLYGGLARLVANAQAMLVCFIAMAIPASVCRYLLSLVVGEGRMEALLMVLLTVAAGILGFLFAVLRSKVISEKEWDMVPTLQKWAKRMNHLFGNT
ncbi:putative polysaccharide biosynthesis protein [Halalkalibacterium halodurans]|uniref:putative polysaccharide biosynthesis protein n=1 Tax=Halalkalibacterium halodurans TaxID=86665 RepID=UPI002AA974E8|nr:polysaccharide biosynthesis protein [Halalkalibacterium halodurans]MDY7220574.1 polysaccharide biosynthesis protein [Halalkalibacterium halodurans]MDY7239813.1 polysaccharide biosynthesis protein [Halalkalibacterium halodurans]